MLVSDFCPGTCLISSGERCAIDNPYEGLDKDAQLVSLFGSNATAVCSTCAVPGQMCLVDFCTTTGAILCPATCYQNDLSVCAHRPTDPSLLIEAHAPSRRCSSEPPPHDPCSASLNERILSHAPCLAPARPVPLPLSSPHTPTTRIRASPTRACSRPTTRLTSPSTTTGSSSPSSDTRATTLTRSAAQGAVSSASPRSSAPGPRSGRSSAPSRACRASYDNDTPAPAPR